MRSRSAFIFAVTLFVLSSFASALTAEKSSDGLDLQLPDGHLKVQIYSPRVSSESPSHPAQLFPKRKASVSSLRLRHPIGLMNERLTISC